MAETHYELLDVPADAGVDDIRGAYHRLVLQHHPDVNSDPEAVVITRRLNEAYATLSDPERRAQYDLLLMITRKDWPTISVEPAAVWQGVEITPADALRAHRRTLWSLRLNRLRIPIAVVLAVATVGILTRFVRPAVVAELDPPFRLSVVSPDHLMVFDRVSPTLETLRRDNERFSPLISRYMSLMAEVPVMTRTKAVATRLNSERTALFQTLAAGRTLRADCSRLERETDTDVLQAARWRNLVDYFALLEERVRNSIAIAELQSERLAPGTLDARLRVLLRRDHEFARRMQRTLTLSP